MVISLLLDVFPGKRFASQVCRFCYFTSRSSGLRSVEMPTFSSTSCLNSNRKKQVKILVCIKKHNQQFETNSPLFKIIFRSSRGKCWCNSYVVPGDTSLPCHRPLSEGLRITPKFVTSIDWALLTTHGH